MVVNVFDVILGNTVCNTAKLESADGLPNALAVQAAQNTSNVVSVGRRRRQKGTQRQGI
jgi:hypothetical protein